MMFSRATLLSGKAGGILNKCRAVVLMAVFSCACAYSQQNRAVLINLQSGESAALMNALRAQGLDPVLQDSGSKSFSGSLLIVQAQGTITTETLLGIKAFVRRGGSLLMGLDEKPGNVPVQLSFLSPTTAWSTNMKLYTPIAGEIMTGAFDTDLFGTSPQTQFTLPYFFNIRPVSAVERGAARYERYKINGDGGKWVFNHEAGAPIWTRPLINRDWRVRVHANDRAGSPLLITGRYGAGRVAVFASGLTGEGSAREAFWKPVISWLTERRPVASDEPTPSAIDLPIDGVTADVKTGVLHVALKNPGIKPISVQVVGRILTWEGAPVGDSIESVEVPANGTASVDLSMPLPGPTQYQALDWRRAYVVRLGVISKSGATLLAERSVPVDFTPSTGIELSTDNLYRVLYPYPTAPGYGGATGIVPRMGSPVEQYAYPPSSPVHATVVLTNGVHNIAPAATVTDETNPGDPSIVAINDAGAHADKGPRGGFQGYGAWVGKAGSDNVLRFHFATPVTVTAVTLLGSANRGARKSIQHNPGAVEIECDGKAVLRKNGLDGRFDNDEGLVRLAIEPVKTSDLVVRLPWVPALIPTGKRAAPWLGEIEITGSQTALTPEVHGEATLVLRDAMSSVETIVGRKSVAIPPGGRVEWSETVMLPRANNSFYQLQVRFAGQTRSLPVLAIQPEKMLHSMASQFPPDSPTMGFIVTKGFRQEFSLGTGTQDTHSSWESPDDLVWSYSHQVDQVATDSHNWPEWLYVTDTSMRHYANPWGLFLNGENIFTAAAPQLLDRMEKQKSWSTSTKVGFHMSDRWDSGPALAQMYGWQELIAFDEYLRSQGRLGLAGSTRSEIDIDVDRNHAAEWGVWHELRYVETVGSLSKMFADAGKELSITGQGIPMTSNKDADVIGRTVKGMSSDNTWAMEHESVPFTTGRQLGAQAYNPAWQLGFNMVWGWNSTTLNNPYWYAAVGTTEPSRRHYYDLAWRGIVDQDGDYQSSFAYGFGQNGGNAWTTTLNDYQQMWNASERFSLVHPDHPLGAGLIVSSSVVDAPESTYFSGGGMGGAADSDKLIHRVAGAFQKLHDSGVNIPFTGNILGIGHARDHSPFILLDLSEANPQELEVLKSLAATGSRIAAFAGRSPLSTAAAELFGIAPDGTPHRAKDAGIVGVHTLSTTGNFLYIPFPVESLTPESGLQLAPILQTWLDLPVVLPSGITGYSFLSGGKTMVVLEDCAEQARVLSVRVRATGSSARAISLDDHNSLPVQRNGTDWVVQLPIRPGDGEVVVLEQSNLNGDSK